MALAMGQKFVWVLLVLGNLVTISMQASSEESDHYVAAVVEYAPVSGATLKNKEQIFMQNVAVYGCFMEEAAKKGVDIIVFPEIGLASYGVPQNPDGTPSLAFYVPEPGSNPCNDNSTEISQGLRDLSCAAARHKLYAVVNLPERVNCSGCPCPGFPVTVDGEECPPSGAYYHNTNVVFDRTGAIVARYRKFNLFGEPGFVPTQEPELAIFDTDFGVSFGTFICFDIMFEKPAAELAREHGICDFAFPTAWFSEVPFLTAVQAQLAWAYSLDVNLLAAGYDKPEAGSAGSGIFVGRGGALQMAMPNETTSRLLVATVPKMERCRDTPALRERQRRAQPVDDENAEGYDDDETAEERTPLSAFHHIVRKRKLGRIDPDDEGEPEEVVDESAPAFIHHTMYDRSNEDEQPGDDEPQEDEEEADDEDTEQTPTGDYETKMPPHFMGLKQAGAQDDDQGCSEDAVGGSAENEQKEGIPEKEIPTSTTTETDSYGFSEPSQNPDLLKLYQEEPVETFPEEFLEIEVPEERSFEPESDHEYFKLNAEGETPPPVHEKEHHSPEGGGDTPVWEDSVGVQQRPSEEERNATELEIEDTRKQFEWLTDDKEDSKPRDSHGEEAPKSDHIDDTDDVLADDHGLHLLDEGGREELALHHQQVDDTDDVLSEHHGVIDGGGHEEAAPRHDTVDDTDDVLPDLSGAEDTSSEQGAGDAGQTTEEWETGTAADDKPPAKGPCKLKTPPKRQRGSRRDRAKRNTDECKCKKRPEEQKPPGDGDDTVTDEDTQADEPQLETVAEDTQPEEEPSRGEESFVEAVTEVTQPEEQPAKGDAEVDSGRPKKCRPRDRSDSDCPAFSDDGILNDGRVTKSSVGLFLKRDHLEVYKTFTLSTESLIENSTVVLCHGTFCCNFHVVLEVNADVDKPRYAYRLAAFDGVRSFDDVATGGLQVCAVIPCSHEEMDSCGMLTLPDDAAYATVFRNISVSGVFSSNRTLVTANTLGPGLLPLQPDRYSLAVAPLGDTGARYTLTTTPLVQKDGVSLYTFAIYSRIFNRDGQPATEPK